MKDHGFFGNRTRPALIIFLGLLAGLAVPAVPAQKQYLGAAAALQKISGQTNTPEEAESPQEKERARLRADIEDFGKRVAALPPEEAAKGWLALFDRFGKVARAAVPDNGAREDPLAFQSVMETLPPPAAWEALSKAVEARPTAKGLSAASRETCLRLLAHTLTGNRTAQKADMSSLETTLAKADRNESYMLGQMYDNLNEALLESSDDPAAIMTSLERRLARSQDDDNFQQLQLPNLVSLVGTNKAEEFLRRALRTSHADIDIMQGDETKRLARKLALEMVAELKIAQWNLAESLDATELYEAMAKRFIKTEAQDQGAPDQSNAPTVFSTPRFHQDDWQRGQAECYYLLGLIVQHRTKEAVAVAQKIGKEQQIYIPEEALLTLERSGHGPALNDFFHELLSQNPNLPFWDQYVQIAARADKADEMLALAQKAAAREDLSERHRKSIQSNLSKALLAADKVDEGVKEMEKTLTAGTNEADEVSEPYQNQYGNTPAHTGLTLARIGHLLGRKEWVEEGVKTVRMALAGSGGKRNQYDEIQVVSEFVALLAELDRGPEAESVPDGRDCCGEPYRTRKSQYDVLRRRKFGTRLFDRTCPALPSGFPSGGRGDVARTSAAMGR